MCQFFVKLRYPVSVVQVGHHCAQQIDRQSALQTIQKENTDRTPFTLAFHPHNHAVKSILIENFNHFKTIQRQVLSFRDLHQFHSKATKTLAIFWSEVHYKLMTNLKFSNALAHDAKPVLPAPPSPLSRPRSPEWRCIACSETSFQSIRLIHFLRLPV